MFRFVWTLICSIFTASDEKSDLFMFPAGFVQEDLQCGVFRRFHQMPCALYELQVPLTVYQQIKQRILLMQYTADIYHYNCLGVVLCKLEFAYQRRYHYFCSQFVADLLQRSGALNLAKRPRWCSPATFFICPNYSCVIRDSSINYI